MIEKLKGSNINLNGIFPPCAEEAALNAKFFFLLCDGSKYFLDCYIDKQYKIVLMLNSCKCMHVIYHQADKRTILQRGGVKGQMKIRQSIKF